MDVAYYAHQIVQRVNSQISNGKVAVVDRYYITKLYVDNDGNIWDKPGFLSRDKKLAYNNFEDLEDFDRQIDYYTKDEKYE